MFQSSLTYDVTVEADGYDRATEVIDFANGNRQMDFVLTQNMTGINDVDAQLLDPNAPIYDLMGRRVQGQLTQGIYIQNGRKFIVR